MQFYFKILDYIRVITLLTLFMCFYLVALANYILTSDVTHTYIKNLKTIY